MSEMVRFATAPDPELSLPTLVPPSHLLGLAVPGASETQRRRCGASSTGTARMLRQNGKRCAPATPNSSRKSSVGADERVQALTDALATAREVTTTYRAQFSASDAPEDSAARPRKRAARAQRSKQDADEESCRAPAIWARNLARRSPGGLLGSVCLLGKVCVEGGSNHL